MKYKGIFVAIVLSVMLAASTNAFAVKDALVKNTSWEVRDFLEMTPHSVPWIFRPNRTVVAGNLWEGTWKEDEKESNRIHVTIFHKADNAPDIFDVVFLPGDPSKSRRWFIAVRGGEPYRLGLKR